MTERRFRAFRRFHLVREEDVSGTSGTGIVAEGVQFNTSKVTLAWTTKFTSVAVYDSMAEMVAIHGHEGRTKVSWVDDGVETPCHRDSDGVCHHNHVAMLGDDSCLDVPLLARAHAIVEHGQNVEPDIYLGYTRRMLEEYDRLRGEP